MKHSNLGFTLIELLIVSLIIGLLASFAIPAYNEYVIRGKLAEARSGLSDGRVKMEQFFQDNKTYVGGPCPAQTESFTFACTNLAAATYTITATGIDNVSAFSFTINESNTRTSTTPWGGSTSCWVAKKGGIC